MADKRQQEWDRVRNEKYPGYSNSFLKNKPKGLSDNEVLFRGSTSRWKKGRYRKQAEKQEAKEHKAYVKDNATVKAGDSPIEGTKEEYVRRNQVQDKLAARKKRISSAGQSPAKTKRSGYKRNTKKFSVGK